MKKSYMFYIPYVTVFLIASLIFLLGFRIGIHKVEEKYHISSRLETMTKSDKINHVVRKLGCPSYRIDSYSSAIYHASNYFRIDWKWICAVITQESRWNSNAKSFISTQLPGDSKKEYAYGLMQIKPSTAVQCASDLGISFNKNDLYDGTTSIYIGTYYLAQRKLSQGGSIILGIMAYNAGDRGLKEGRHSDEYIKKIKDYYREICNEIRNL